MGMLRRTFLSVFPAAMAAPSKETHVYKRVGGVEIRADVYRGGKACIFWIHGGALISGHRGNLRGWQLEKYLAAGFSVVSIDYRLAPEVKIGAILSDVEDAWKWVHREGPKLFGIDPRRVGVVGHSAGGYLTLACSYRAKPQPRALVSYYGYGDLAGDWYAKPDPFYSRLAAVPREEAYSAVGNGVVTGTPGANQRGRFYLYCRQNGLWPKEVVGLDPAAQNKGFDPYCPLRNVRKGWPPTMLLHGDKDTDVPFAQSELMAAEYQRRGVKHEFVRIPGGGHGFDGRMEDPAAKGAFERAVEFLKRETG